MPTDSPAGPIDPKSALAAAAPQDRRAVLARLLAELPPPLALAGASLNGADLGTRGGEPAADLRGAVLRQASFRGANLAGVVFERADLSDADLAGADLAGADLSRALVEDADLTGAGLRFAVLREAVLDGSRFGGADLWGARAAGAVLARTDLRGAVLEEADLSGADLTGADLRGAVLRKAVLRGANLTGADLEGAVLTGADLTGAVLRDAKLQGVSLVGCPLIGAHLADAWLERTRLHLDQLDGAVGEERAGEFEQARRAYLVLEKNFETLGDPDAASWAYCRKRRMEKWDCWSRARREWAAGRRRRGLSWAARFANLQFVELLCDYGEGIPRVLSSILVLFLAFVVLYGVTGSVTRAAPDGAGRTVTRHPLDLAMFSLLTMAQLDTGQAGLEPVNEYVFLLSGVEALLTIFLTGLVGFVVGNRIRR